MTAEQMLRMGGYPNTPEGRAAFYNEFPDEQSFMAKYGGHMAMGGITNEIGFPQQPVANKFYSEGFRPSVPFGFYEEGGLTNEIGFPQQPIADKFYSEGFRPSVPFGFYAEGGLTNEIAFPQQPVDAWIHAHTPYVPSYEAGGDTQFGGNVGMGMPDLMSYGGIKNTLKSFIKRAEGGEADGEDQDDYLSAYRNRFLQNIQENSMNALAEQTAKELATGQSEEEVPEEDMQEGSEEAYAQYGYQMGDPYNQINPQTISNQYNLVNQRDEIKDSLSGAWGDLKNAAIDLSYNQPLVKAQVGINKDKAASLDVSPIGPYKLEFKNYIQNQEAIKDKEGNEIQWDPNLKTYKKVNKSKYTQAPGRAYLPNSYNRYMNWSAKGADGSSSSLENLLSKFNPESTYLLSREDETRRGLGRILWGNEPRKITYRFSSTMNPRTMEGLERVSSKQDTAPQPQQIPGVNYFPGVSSASDFLNKMPQKGIPLFQSTPGDMTPSRMPKQNVKLNKLNNRDVFTETMMGIPSLNPYITQPGYDQNLSVRDFVNPQADLNYDENFYPGAPRENARTLSRYVDNQGADVPEGKVGTLREDMYNPSEYYNFDKGFATGGSLRKFVGDVEGSSVNSLENSPSLSIPAWANNPFGMQQPAMTAAGVYGNPQQVTIADNQVVTNPVSGKDPNTKNVDWTLEGKMNRFYGPAAAQTILAGTSLATGLINSANLPEINQQIQRNTLADNQFYATQQPNRGDYNWTGMSTGMLRPDQYVQVQQPGITPAYMGEYGGQFAYGGMYNEGDELELTEDEIQDILANGGQIEYLD